MHMKWSCPSVLSALVALLLLAATANAADDGAAYRLEPVKVTAQKQEENVQDIPASITAIGAAEAEDARILSIDDLASRVPNLGFFTGGMDLINFVTLRGETSDPHNNVSSVALYVDDVPVTSNLGFLSQLYDIERIEVLRGPQATLYGRNSLGGVINVVTRQPGDNAEGKITVEAGTHDMGRVQISGSGPLVKERLFVSGAGQFYQEDGWVKNAYDGGHIDDKKNYSGQGKIRFTPSRDLECTLSASATKYDGGSFGMYPYPTSSKREVDTNEPGYDHSAVDQEALRIRYRLNGEWSLTSVTSRRFTDADYMIDYDFSTTPGFETHKFDDYLDLSQEIRANYVSGRASTVLGVMADVYNRKIQYEYTTMGMLSRARDDTRTYAAFVHSKIPLSEKWALLLGMRADRYGTDFRDSTGYTDSDSWTTYSPKAALEYSLTADNLLYTSLSRGYRAAGYNSYTPTNGRYKFDEESVWALEFGSKNTFWNKRGKVDAAVFANRKINTQVEQYTSGMTPMPYISNAGDTTAYGAELETSCFVTPELELFGTAGYTYVRFGKFSDAYGDHRGNRLPYVPDYTYSVGAQYRQAGGFMARAEALGASKVYLDSRNSGSIPAHTSVNAKVGWEWEHTDVYLFADNIFDEHHDYKGAFGGGYAVATPGFTAGLGLTQRF